MSHSNMTNVHNTGLKEHWTNYPYIASGPLTSGGDLIQTFTPGASGTSNLGATMMGTFSTKSAYEALGIKPVIFVSANQLKQKNNIAGLADFIDQNGSMAKPWILGVKPAPKAPTDISLSF